MNISLHCAEVLEVETFESKETGSGMVTFHLKQRHGARVVGTLQIHGDPLERLQLLSAWAVAEGAKVP